MEICSSLLEEIHKDRDYIQHLRTATYTNITSIDYIKEPVTYEQFFRGYLLPNRPCILGRWATEGWLSRCDWVTDAGSINHEFLKENFGESKAPVADCNKEEYSAHPKEDTTVSDYLHYMQTRQCEGQDTDRCLYLKDWHFQREFPSYKAYTTPVYFRSDWLNEFWDTRDDVTDDYRFVYIGVKGSCKNHACAIEPSLYILGKPAPSRCDKGPWVLGPIFLHRDGLIRTEQEWRVMIEY